MSPRYSDRSRAERLDNGLAGDPAEEAVVTALRSLGKQPVEFGLRRTPTERALAATLPRMIRHAPDFIIHGRFVEAQGCGVDRTVTFKAEKLDALTDWSALMPVMVGVFVQPDRRVIFADLPAVLWACTHPRSEMTVLDAGTKGEKLAFRVPVSVLLDREVVDAFAAERAVRRREEVTA